MPKIDLRPPEGSKKTRVAYERREEMEEGCKKGRRAKERKLDHEENSSGKPVGLEEGTTDAERSKKKTTPTAKGLRAPRAPEGPPGG